MFTPLKLFDTPNTAAPEQFESGGHRSRAKVGGTDRAGKKKYFFFVVPLHFLALKAQLVVLVSAFVVVSTVWSVHCLLFFYSRCPRAQPFVKVGGACAAPVPHGVGATAPISSPLQVLRVLTRILIRSVLFSAIGGYCSSLNYYNDVYQETFVLNTWSPTPRSVPLTVIEMVYITISYKFVC